jgi:hypothetical protein
MVASIEQLRRLQQPPEWIRIDVAVKLFGASRSKFYEWIAERKIKSFCLRDRGKVKGIRLLSFDSICEFYEREVQKEAAI